MLTRVCLTSLVFLMLIVTTASFSSGFMDNKSNLVKIEITTNTTNTTINGTSITQGVVEMVENPRFFIPITFMAGMFAIFFTLRLVEK